MKRKIFAFYIILVIIGLSITSFFTSQLTRNIYKDEVLERLVSNTSLIEYHLEHRLSQDDDIDYNLEAERLSQVLQNTQSVMADGYNTRVTLIDFSGKVLGESEVEYREMENHLDRPEIQQAVNGNIGHNIRFSTTMNIDFLYVAVPLEQHNLVIRLSVPLVDLAKINGIIWKYAAAGISAGILMTTILALIFSSQLTNPIRELASLSHDIADGNYSRRINTIKGNELGELAESLNEMAQKLERTIADLQDKNMKFDSVMHSMSNGVIAVDRNYRIILMSSIASRLFDLPEQDSLGRHFTETVRNGKINSLLEKAIQEDKQYTEEVKTNTTPERVIRITASPLKSRDSEALNSGGIISVHDITNIRKLEQIRTEFVSNVTHELKTPLTSIRGFVETLRNGAVNDPVVATRFLDIIDIEAERLYMLINDILQLSEIESNQKDINIRRFKLLPVLQDTVSILRKCADGRNVAVRYNVDSELLLEANPDRIKQLLLNLIDNAIKYNREGGYVEVKAYRTEGAINITVSDNGIGIPEKHHERIFERFYRVDKGRSRSMGGTGLGLSIVKHIVHLYNGTISLSSKPGEGTRFLIKLPM